MAPSLLVIGGTSVKGSWPIVFAGIIKFLRPGEPAPTVSVAVMVADVKLTVAA